MLTPGIAYLSQLMLCSAFVILADVTHRSVWVEYLTAHRATNGVFHRFLTITFELRIALVKAICNSLVSSIAVHPEPAALPTQGLLSRRSTDRNAVLFRWTYNVLKVHQCKVPKVHKIGKVSS
ncbi:hypothetical protein [Enterobacter sp. DE0047]|uniref:hypothetical protein n=1 Tax=Enterobacter sp. DE0047 TaxID=2584949 RepID=UPI0011A6C048|nr:hypothetical protein [Enterobacter sp. DE0047]